jgi:flagellar basal-body rod protein FlgF
MPSSEPRDACRDNRIGIPGEIRMQEVMAVMLGALRQDSARVERIGVNLTNALTPGYQREIIVAQPTRVGAEGGFARLLSAGAEGGGVPGVTIARDARPGTLKATGQAWDLALASDGYFEVATPLGPAYTRRGQFQLDGQGRLVTVQGWPVMGLDGEIRPGNGAPSIQANGQIRTADKLVGQLRVVKFDVPGSLRHIDAGYFASETAGTLLPEAGLALRQGFLENANVSHSHEMVDLMRTMRHFESMTRVLQGYDDMIGGAIRKLGDA